MDRKLITLFCVCLLSFSLLFLRVGSISTDVALVEVGTDQSTYSLFFNNTRGGIYDCRFGELVGTSKDYLAAILPSPANFARISTQAALYPQTGVDSLLEKGKPFLLKSSSKELEIPQVTMFSIPKRNAQNQLAKHTLGYIDSSQNKGVCGVESAYDELLSKNSETSSITYTLGGLGKPIYGISPTVRLAPIRTDGVVLTIDKRIQKVVEQVGSAMIKKGAIVVMEPVTAKLRAVASFPDFDLENLGKAVKDEKNSPLLNRAYMPYSVGSTFKLVVAAAALESGISEDLEYNCVGRIKVGEVTFSCHKKSGHGMMNMQTALEVSCNPYFVNIGLMLEKQKLINMASDLSFGKSSEVGEGISTARGNLPTVAELYNPGAVANLSFGQGTLTATPIQLAQMISGIVNGGETRLATLVEGTTKNGKTLDQVYPPSYPIKAMSKLTASRLQEMLVGAAMAENQNSKPKYVTAGGKTSTAQTGKFEGEDEVLQCWFAGFYPEDKPKYVIVVLSEDADSGNQDGAPVFREIVNELTKPLT